MQRLALVKDLENVPGNGFAFAIRVGGEDQFGGLFDRVGDLFHHLFAAVLDFPVHFEVFVWLHGVVLSGQVPNVANGRDHLVARAQILVDGFGLGGGFDDNDVHIALSLQGVPGNQVSGCTAYLAGLAWRRGNMGDDRAPVKPGVITACG